MARVLDVFLSCRSGDSCLKYSERDIVYELTLSMDKEIRDHAGKATRLIRAALESLPSPGRGFANKRRSKHVRPRSDQAHVTRLLTTI
jgi:hypothetical protein